MEDPIHSIQEFKAAINTLLKRPTAECLAEVDLTFAAVLRPLDPLGRARQLGNRRSLLNQIGNGMDSLGFVAGSFIDNELALALRNEGFTLWHDNKMHVVLGMPGATQVALDVKNKRGLLPLCPDESTDVSTQDREKLPPLTSLKEEQAEIERLVRQLFAETPEPAKGFQRQFFHAQIEHMVSALGDAAREGDCIVQFPGGYVFEALYPALVKAGISLWLDKSTYVQFLALPGTSLDVMNTIYQTAGAQFEAVKLVQ